MLGSCTNIFNREDGAVYTTMSYRGLRQDNTIFMDEFRPCSSQFKPKLKSSDKKFSEETVKPFYDLQKNAIGFVRYRVDRTGGSYSVHSFTSPRPKQGRPQGLYIKCNLNDTTQVGLLRFIANKSDELRKLL